jgi:hypothetical protein
MAIYMAVPLAPTSSALDDAVKQNIASESDRYQLQSERGWLIKFDGTSVELSYHLGITGQEKGTKSPVGSAIIVPVSSYFGRGPADMWEWLKTRLEQ